MPRGVDGQRITCPACGQDTSDQPTVADLTVCECCARSLVLLEDGARVATAEDVRVLSPAEVHELRLARPATWRADVRARHARLVGGR